MINNASNAWFDLFFTLYDKNEFLGVTIFKQ